MTKLLNSFAFVCRIEFERLGSFLEKESWPLPLNRIMFEISKMLKITGTSPNYWMDWVRLFYNLWGVAGKLLMFYHWLVDVGRIKNEPFTHLYAWILQGESIRKKINVNRSMNFTVPNSLDWKVFSIYRIVICVSFNQFSRTLIKTNLF